MTIKIRLTELYKFHRLSSTKLQTSYFKDVMEK